MCHRQQGLRGLILRVPVRLRLLLSQPQLLQWLPWHRLLLPHLHNKLRRVLRQNRRRKPHKQYKQRKQLSLRLTHRPCLSRHRPLPLQQPRPPMLPAHMQPKQHPSKNPFLQTTILSLPGKMLLSLQVQQPAMTLQSLPQRMQTLTPVPRPVSLKKLLRLLLLTTALLKPLRRHQRHPLRQPSQPQSPPPQARWIRLPTLSQNLPKPRARAAPNL